VAVRSPELAATDELLQQSSSEAGNVGLEDLFYFLAQLQCLEALSESQTTFVETFQSAVRNVLSQSLSFVPWKFRARLWLGLDSMQKEMARHLTAGERDVLSVEFVFKRISLSDVFTDPLRSCAVAKVRDQQMQCSVESQGGQVEMLRLIKALYSEQRSLALKEFILRVLPTAVLVLSSAVALSMAVLFLRSLLSGA
jgi:hypothetical protein